MSSQLRNPIFVVGCARSGTSLLTRLLSKHPDIANWSEANDIWDPRGYPWSESSHETPPIWSDPVAFTARWWRDTEPRQKEIRAVFGGYQWLKHKPYFLNKSPLNTFRIPYLLSIFPDARFIHSVRDGRAVAYSYARKTRRKIQESPQPYRAIGLAYSFEELVIQLGAFWKDNLEEIARQKEALQLRRKGSLLELTYEELCADRSAVMNRVCDYLGLNPSRFTTTVGQERIENQNHKWQESLDDALIARLVAAANPMLSIRGYT